jgi:hypothetical protein
MGYSSHLDGLASIENGSRVTVTKPRLKAG